MIYPPVPGTPRCPPVTLHKLNLTAPVAVLDPNSLNPTIAAQGNGYRITVTQQVAARDGADEMWRGRFDILDAGGNVVDITSGTWAIVVEVRRIASTVGAQILVVAGLSTRATTTGGQNSWAGYSTGLTQLQRCFVTSTTTNSVTTDLTLSTVRTVFVSVGNTTGNFQLPGGPTYTFTSAGALSLENQFSSSADAAPGTVALVVGVGTDAAGVLTDSTDVEIYACAFPIVGLGA